MKNLVLLVLTGFLFATPIFGQEVKKEKPKKNIFKEFYNGNQKLISTFTKIGLAAETCAEFISKHQWEHALEASQEEWKLRCQLWPKIETQKTKTIDSIARQHGAYFSRVCGAGGGGVMAIFSPPAQKSRVERALLDRGIQHLPSIPTNSGLVVH